MVDVRVTISGKDCVVLEDFLVYRGPDTLTEIELAKALVEYIEWKYSIRDGSGLSPEMIKAHNIVGESSTPSIKKKE